MTRYRWSYVKCVGEKELVGSMNDAEEKGVVDLRTEFLGFGQVESPLSQVGIRTSEAVPIFLLLAKFPASVVERQKTAEHLRGDNRA